MQSVLWGVGYLVGYTLIVVTRVLGHTIVPYLAADRSGLCSMFVKKIIFPHDYGLVARLSF